MRARKRLCCGQEHNVRCGGGVNLRIIPKTHRHRQLPTLFLLTPRPQTKKGGPYSQFLRIRRNCTLIESYEKHSQEMKKLYILRGYPESLLEKQWNKSTQS